jgi:hypothetical protein
METPHDRANRVIFSGLTGLFASLAVWRLTNNWWGWLALALPGGVLVLYGWWLIFTNL